MQHPGDVRLDRWRYPAPARRRRIGVSIAAAVTVSVIAAACSASTTSDDVDAGSDAPVPGVTNDVVTVGVGYVPDPRRLADQLGIEGASVPDGKAVAEAVAASINEGGGVAGRQLELVFHEYAATAADDPVETLYQAACERFTSDHEVYAVFQSPTGVDSLLECLTDRRTLLIGSSPLPGDAGTFNRYAGFFYSPDGMTLDRVALSLVASLDQSDFWDTGAVVGLLRIGRPDFDRVTDDVLKPALDAVGHPVDEEVVVPAVTRTSEIAALSQAAQAAILRMKASGVTHLLFFDERGGLPVYFLYNTAAQDYSAKYAVTSASGLDYVAANVPPAQMEAVVGVGWLPLTDLDRREADELATATTDRCMDILNEAGMELNGGGETQLALATCGDLLWFDHVADQAGTLDHDEFRAVVDGLGDSWEPATTLRTTFDPVRHAGAATAHVLRFDSECGCFTYGDSVTVP